MVVTSPKVRAVRFTQRYLLNPPVRVLFGLGLVPPTHVLLETTRVKIGRRWRSGTANVLPDDDPRARLRRIGRPVNGFMVRAVGTDLLTIRVDLDPESSG